MSILISVLRSRLFSISALSVICAAIVMLVSLNMSAVTVAFGDENHVVMTLHDDPYKSTAAEAPVLEQDRNFLIPDGSIQVQVTADEISTLFYVMGGTVEQVVEEAGVVVGSHDKLNQSADAEVVDGMHIIVNRVEYREFTESVKIPFETEIIYTNTLPKGKTQMRYAGSAGVMTQTYRECIEDGKVIATELVSEIVTTHPVKASQLVGTITGTPVSVAPFNIPLNEGGQPITYKEKFTGRATAYTSDRGDAGEYTSVAGRARVGVVAIDPKKIPYGSKLYIVSEDGSYVYGYAIAGDTGGGVMSGKTLVDLYYDTYEECVRFGVRTMNLYIIE